MPGQTKPERNMKSRATVNITDACVLSSDPLAPCVRCAGLSPKIKGRGRFRVEAMAWETSDEAPAAIKAAITKPRCCGWRHATQPMTATQTHGFPTAMREATHSSPAEGWEPAAIHSKRIKFSACTTRSHASSFEDDSYENSFEVNRLRYCFTAECSDAQSAASALQVIRCWRGAI